MPKKISRKQSNLYYYFDYDSDGDIRYAEIACRYCFGNLNGSRFSAGLFPQPSGKSVCTCINCNKHVLPRTDVAFLMSLIRLAGWNGYIINGHLENDLVAFFEERGFVRF